MEGTYPLGDITTATPYVNEDIVAFPSKDGYVYVLRRTTQLLIWKTFLPDIWELNGDFSQTTPVVIDGALIVCHMKGAICTAFHLQDGAVKWTSRVYDYPGACISGSPSVEGGMLLLGVDAQVQGDTDFIGAFLKVSGATGEVLDTFPLIDPELEDYAGVPASGHQPVIYDGHVIFATGHTFAVPSSVQSCIDDDLDDDSCVDEGVLLHSVVSLTIKTFTLDWATRLSGYDVWLLQCEQLTSCPGEPETYADFGMNPSLVRGFLMDDGVKRDILVIGQRSGVAWNLNAKDGEINEGRVLCPGGELGGFTSGGATDGSGYYLGCVNSNNACHYINSPLFTKTYGGSLSRMNIRGSSISWQIPDPNSQISVDADNYNEIVFGSSMVGSPSLVNDLVIATSASLTGSLLIFSSHTGTILYRYDTGASVFGGVAIYDNCFYFAHGADSDINSYWTPGYTFFTFCAQDLQ
jgi:outer membrane protein assembly factor BamB